MVRSLLLTPGPLTTTDTVKTAMMGDWCTWEEEYKKLTRGIRSRLVELAGGGDQYTAVLMQGSGTFSVEAAIGTFISKEDHVLIGVNGAYGRRIVEIAERLHIPYSTVTADDTKALEVASFEEKLRTDSSITHVMFVHSETTSGLLNPVQDICRIAKQFGKTTMVDAMSSFGGMDMSMADWNMDVLVSSSNKCLQGVPGFGFVLANRALLKSRKGCAPSLSLDVYDQFETMENDGGKWRFTSPTHAVHAFSQALAELIEEGGVPVREARYRKNQETLIAGMEALGFKTAVSKSIQSPFIVSFLYPDRTFSFDTFYTALKADGFIIYPGKLTDLPAFRIGTIGDIHVSDIQRLLESIKTYMTVRGEIRI
ncbi:2-aminoethylphosphonate--pyruvate transaminase [Domibacillus aminovorans]|uniref:2-aminoethylphosphonate--pyruvate transaminase n=1 Tax=Domibacillus aminovorans TaxID=29332 RepID=A0A177L715_9BACI|nr:2-aminoethylphosphonate--pyruvate transaminase [Domibacillus aminovorans]OAH61156.1 2-aminoethylphosphonate--pyruvate aminotransferase [Domibacillus aminovorans]